MPSSDQRERDGRRRSLCPDAFCDSAASARFWNSPVPSQDAYAAERIPENPRQSSHLPKVHTAGPGTPSALDKDQVKAHARAHVFNREGEITIAVQSGNCSGVGVSIAFLSGAVLGAVAAILYAPRSGEETRTALRGYARRTEEEMLEKAREIRKDISETVDEAKQYLRETEATIAAALAAGKDAFKKERADRA